MSLPDRFFGNGDDEDDEYEEYDEHFDDLVALNQYLTCPVVEVRRFLNTGEVKLVEEENTETSWIKTDSDNMIELLEAR